jgi:hypothetical protein
MTFEKRIRETSLLLWNPLHNLTSEKFSADCRMLTVFGRGEIEMGIKCAWNLILSLGEKQMEGTINNGGNVSFLVHPTAKPSPEERRTGKEIRPHH